MSRSYTRMLDRCLVLKKPLTKKALKARTNKAGILSVNVPISLGDLIDCDINDLNDWADENILDISLGASLSDITYTAFDVILPGTDHSFARGGVVLKITADVSDIIGEE